MRVPLVIGKESNQAQAPAESVERLLNAYLDAAPTGKEPAPVYGTPGLTLWASGLDGATRGELEMAGTAYSVNGNRLYSFTSAGVPTSLGTIPNSDDVCMAGDGTNVVCTTEGAIYVWNATSGLQLVTDPDAPDAGSVAWSDGYFIFGELDTEQYFLAGLSDPIDYEALDFASAEANPDKLVRPFVHHRILYLYGQRTIEAAQNTGGADFPFARYEGVNIDVGLAGKLAVCATNDAMFFQAQDDTIRRIDGLTATKISTARISKLIGAWSDKTATVASAHVWGDHLFVVFRNPDGCVTWDQNTERWHERASYGSDTWRVNHMIECYGLKLFGSATEGKIYKLDEPGSDTYAEDGAILPFRCVTPFVYVQNKRLTVGELEVVAQTGAAPLGLNPQITCERTKDGETWSERKQRSLGLTGQRGKRVTFGPQGQGRALAFRFGIDHPVQRAILGAYVEADVEA